MNYTKVLKRGKLIRLTHKEFFNDGTDDENSGWKEELWKYDSSLDLFICYYPISTYEEGFCTYHISPIIDYNKEEYSALNIEDDNIPNSINTLKELALHQIEQMDDSQLRLFLSV